MRSWARERERGASARAFADDGSERGDQGEGEDKGGERKRKGG